MGALPRRSRSRRDRRLLHVGGRRDRRAAAPADTGARLSTAVALAAIRWLGFIPAELDAALAAGVARLASQLDGDPADLAAYAPAERTAREHRQRAAVIARFCDVDDSDLARVEDLLVEHALEHDSPLVLLRAAARHLLERQLLRPGVSTLERLVASVRARAERETHERLSPVLDDNVRRALDALCVTDIALGVSRLVWLGREATLASPAQIVAQLEKLAFLRELGAAGWDLDAVAANRRRQLAALARRSTTAALAGRPDRLRYPFRFCPDAALSIPLLAQSARARSREARAWLRKARAEHAAVTALEEHRNESQKRRDKPV